MESGELDSLETDIFISINVQFSYMVDFEDWIDSRLSEDNKTVYVY